MAIENNEKIKRLIFYFLFQEIRSGNSGLFINEDFISKYQNESRLKRLLNEKSLTLEHIVVEINKSLKLLDKGTKFFVFYEWKLLGKEEITSSNAYSDVTNLLRSIEENFFDHYEEIIQEKEIVDSIMFFLKNQSLAQFPVFFLKDAAKTLLEIRERIKELILPLILELMEPLKKVNDYLIDILKSINDLIVNINSDTIKNMLRELGVDINSELIETLSDYVESIGIDALLEEEIKEIAMEEADKFRRQSLSQAADLAELEFNRFYQEYIAEHLKANSVFSKESSYKETRKNVISKLNDLLSFYYPENYLELSDSIYQNTIQRLARDLMEDCFLNTKEKICMDFSRVLISGETNTSLKKELTTIVSTQQAFYKEMVMLDKRTQSLSKRIDNTFSNNELIPPKNIVFGQKTMDVMDPIKYSMVAMLSKSGWALNAKMINVICDSNGTILVEPMWVDSPDKVAVMDALNLNNATNQNLIKLIDNWKLRKPGNSSDEKLAVAVFLLYGIFFLAQNIDVFIKEQVMNMFKKLDLPTDLILMTRKVEKDFKQLYKEHSGRKQ